MVENLGRGRAGRPKLLEGGVVSLGLGWERETRGPKRQDQGTRTAGGNRYATRNNLGEIEVEVELELGRVQKKKKRAQATRARRRCAGTHWQVAEVPCLPTYLLYLQLQGC